MPSCRPASSPPRLPASATPSPSRSCSSPAPRRRHRGPDPSERCANTWATRPSSPPRCPATRCSWCTAPRSPRRSLTTRRNATAVAELTIAFALMLIRGVPGSARYLLDGGQHGGSTYEGSQFIGGEAASMTLGLVGLGNVGREVAARGRTLGFTLLGYDPAPPGAIPPDVTMVALDDLLSRSDLVSVHARATAGNRHMFGASAFGRMPRGSFFINTARESLVDEDALAGALADGSLAGAALDVAEPRKAGDRHPLLDLPNVIITPHIGGATRETLRRGAEL